MDLARLIKRATYRSAPAQAVAASGAISLLTQWHLVTVSGTKAYTVANGLWIGQPIHLETVSVASTPHGVVTPALATGFTSFDLILVGQIVQLRWAGLTEGWRIENVSTKNGVALPIFT